jgi:AcrR family transcriptional regulator
MGSKTAASVADPDSGPLQDWRSYPPLELPSILRVALTQIVQHGYDATSVRTIAREVGVTVPALYYHFENKQAILVALMDHAMEIVSQHVAGALATAGKDPVRRLSAVVESIALYMAHYRELAFLDSERRALTTANLQQYAARRDRIESELRRTIEEGRAHRVFRTDDPAECGRAILSMCQGIAGWFNTAGPRSPEEIAERYVRIALAVVEYASD